VRWSNRRPSTADADDRKSAKKDQDVARLTAKADLIIEELDQVVKQMAVMLRDAYGLTDDR
jgi:hypothetical protein